MSNYSRCIKCMRKFTCAYAGSPDRCKGMISNSQLSQYEIKKSLVKDTLKTIEEQIEYKDSHCDNKFEPIRLNMDYKTMALEQLEDL